MNNLKIWSVVSQAIKKYLKIPVYMQLTNGERW